MVDHKTLLKSFTYSFEGVIHAIYYNQNMRIHIVVAILVIAASLIFKVSPFEMVILGIMILLVIMAEMINTAIEEMVDLIVTKHYRQAKIAKDVASGMVLVAAVGSVIVGILIFVPHIAKFVLQ